jgi:hypothetical protein
MARAAKQDAARVHRGNFIMVFLGIKRDEASNGRL